VSFVPRYSFTKVKGEIHFSGFGVYQELVAIKRGILTGMVRTGHS
jgi:hypothetical protein